MVTKCSETPAPSRDGCTPSVETRMLASRDETDGGFFLRSEHRYRSTRFGGVYNWATC